jgi:hypothetical protein
MIAGNINNTLFLSKQTFLSWKVKENFHYLVKDKILDDPQVSGLDNRSSYYD